MNYYNLLNVPEDATLKEIQKNYRELSFRYHPDKNPDDPYSEERYKQISEAYNILSNYEKRKNYDNSRNKSIMTMNQLPFFTTNFERLMNMDNMFNDNMFNDNFLLTDKSNETMSSNSKSVSISTVIENGVKKTKKITNDNGKINVEEYQEDYDNGKIPLIQKPFSFF